MEVVCEGMCLSHGRVQMRASSEILIDLPVTTMISCLKSEKEALSKQWTAQGHGSVVVSGCGRNPKQVGEVDEATAMPWSLIGMRTEASGAKEAPAKCRRHLD